MAESNNWDSELENYVREGEPSRSQKAKDWQTAIGLQAVDGLETSHYLLETAKEHIEGRISIGEVQDRIWGYYKQQSNRAEDRGTEEADKVSGRISQLLGEHAFTFSPAQLQSIHRRLFEGIIPHAGEFRTYNITKSEWVLNGNTVYYASANSIAETLQYDFEVERSFDYRGLTQQETIQRFAAFISGIWQIHPFSEGNTRTTAVFAIKHLSSLGYSVNNDLFKDNSWYFRNALVRANYNDHILGVRSTKRYLEAFLENLLTGSNHDLKNRYLHINWDNNAITAKPSRPTPQVAPQVAPQVELLLRALGEDELSARELMEQLGLADRKNFVKNYLNPALEAGVVQRTIPEKPTSRLQKYRRAR